MSEGKVWCASSGSYSDYSVDCCFTSEALAHKYVQVRMNLTDSEYARFRELEQMKNESSAFWNNRVLVDEYNALGQKIPHEEYFVEEFQLWDQVPVATTAA